MGPTSRGAMALRSIPVENAARSYVAARDEFGFNAQCVVATAASQMRPPGHTQSGTLLHSARKDYAQLVSGPLQSPSTAFHTSGGRPVK